jgi:pseudouridine synthase
MKAEKVKIAKFLAECGIGSRRHCETLVSEGKVRVNGRTMKNVAERINPEKDVIEYSGKRIKPIKKAVFALNKPRGYVSTLSDPYAGLTITDLIPSKYRSLGLKPVGRLDKESEGLMLLTNDGQLAYRLTHPKYDVPKVYHVKLDKTPPKRILDVIRRGVHLPGEGKLRPMGVREIGRGREPASELELTLREGRKQEIRRVFAMFGFTVQRLQRAAMGPVKLGQIKKGHIMKLTEPHVAKLRKSCGLSDEN